MKKMNLLSLAGACALTLAAAPRAHSADTKINPGAASSASATTTTTTTTSANTDADFAAQAAQINMAEVKLGKLAQKKAHAQAVKDYGKHMEVDHNLASDELKRIAKSEKMQLPSKPTAEDQAAYDRMSKMSGAAFDEAYISHMVDGHAKAIQLFTKEAQQGQNPTLKLFAEKMLPSLRAHHEVAQIDARTTGATSKAR